jgi:hypothetical protein
LYDPGILLRALKGLKSPKKNWMLQAPFERFERFERFEVCKVEEFVVPE